MEDGPFPIWVVFIIYPLGIAALLSLVFLPVLIVKCGAKIIRSFKK